MAWFVAWSMFITAAGVALDVPSWPRRVARIVRRAR